ncbi:hypothetical protein N7535_008233 [Penicillium sp. DV-2018c]|nr:hypothetical protein N7461_004271 [Penicillium sp. DV-2018c]KAJ5566595.1 hypothetical protein N7535_008233 [Penicillium sp. DV-2018c]
MISKEIRFAKQVQVEATDFCLSVVGYGIASMSDKAITGHMFCQPAKWPSSNSAILSSLV